MKPEILIVEDEPAIADNLRYALETDGFSPVWCATGAEAMERLRAREPALILLDVGLPDISGFELCKSIRKHSQTPIIFLTARSEEVDRIVGLEIGGDDYLVKPFSPRELTARVKAVLRRGAPPQSSPPSHAAKNSPFRLDEERRRISYFGQALALSRNEYHLLKALLERPGRVLSRDQLMDLAWEDPAASMDRTVDAHIKSLRAKLKAVRPGADPIETHRGIGYSLKEPA